MSGRRRASCTSLIVLAGMMSALVLGAAPPSDELPAHVVGVLNRHFPGWRLARLSPQLTALLSQGDAAGWVAGDFDGDGRMDYVVQIVRGGARPDEAQAVVAILARRGGPMVVHTMPETEAAYLRLAQRGERVPDLDADVMGRRTVVLQTDGVHILFGREAAVTCALEASIWRCFVSGD